MTVQQITAVPTIPRPFALCRSPSRAFNMCVIIQLYGDIYWPFIHRYIVVSRRWVFCNSLATCMPVGWSLLLAHQELDWSRIAWRNVVHVDLAPQAMCRLATTTNPLKFERKSRWAQVKSRIRLISGQISASLDNGRVLRTAVHQRSGCRMTIALV